MTPQVLYNGAFLSEREASIGVDDGGWLHGAGLFETMRAENGRIFRLESHMQRLMKSAAKLLRPIERDSLPCEDDFNTLLERLNLKTARVRMTVSAGCMRANQADSEAELNVCVTAVALTTYPAKLYEDGVSVIVSAYRRSPTDPIAGHKTTSHLPQLLALREAQSARCVEALWFTTNHQLAEGSISNVFVVKNGAVKTPPLDTPVLPGIARGVVLEIAAEMEIEAGEARLTIDDLLDADEVFLTNTIMQVMPVVGVEKHVISEGRVGPVSRRLREEFRALVKKECGHP